MPNIPCLLFRPSVVRQTALEHSEMVALLINMANGIIVLLAAGVPLVGMFTFSVVVLSSILFGPSIGIIVSSIYSRTEWMVGRKLGGKAPRQDIYRIYAWSFLPFGFSVLLYSMLLLPFKNPSTAIYLSAMVPSLIIIGFAIRNYSANITIKQQFTRARGLANLALTFVLFLLIVAIVLALFLILYKYNSGDDLKMLFMLI
jgi:hypothetical protein